MFLFLFLFLFLNSVPPSGVIEQYNTFTWIQTGLYCVRITYLMTYRSIHAENVILLVRMYLVCTARHVFDDTNVCLIENKILDALFVPFVRLRS